MMTSRRSYREHHPLHAEQVGLALLVTAGAAVVEFLIAYYRAPGEFDTLSHHTTLGDVLGVAAVWLATATLLPGVLFGSWRVALTVDQRGLTEHFFGRPPRRTLWSEITRVTVGRTGASFSTDRHTVPLGPALDNWFHLVTQSRVHLPTGTPYHAENYEAQLPAAPQRGSDLERWPGAKGGEHLVYRHRAGSVAGFARYAGWVAVTLLALPLVGYLGPVWLAANAMSSYAANAYLVGSALALGSFRPTDSAAQWWMLAGVSVLAAVVLYDELRRWQYRRVHTARVVEASATGVRVETLAAEGVWQEYDWDELRYLRRQGGTVVVITARGDIWLTSRLTQRDKLLTAVTGHGGLWVGRPGGQDHSPGPGDPGARPRW